LCDAAQFNGNAQRNLRLRIRCAACERCVSQSPCQEATGPLCPTRQLSLSPYHHSTPATRSAATAFRPLIAHIISCILKPCRLALKFTLQLSSNEQPKTATNSHLHHNQAGAATTTTRQQQQRQRQQQQTTNNTTNNTNNNTYNNNTNKNDNNNNNEINKEKQAI
jgi:hypothetical protein